MKKIVITLLIYLTICTAGGMYIPDEIHETIGMVENIQGSLLDFYGEDTLYGPHEITLDAKHALVYDLFTGHLVEYWDITPGTPARIAYDLQGDAIIVWLNYESYGAAALSVIVSDNIQYSSDACVFLSADGKYRVALEEDTIIIDPIKGEMTFADVAPGQEYFLWVDMITASAPSLVYPEKVVLVYE